MDLLDKYGIKYNIVKAIPHRVGGAENDHQQDFETEHMRKYVNYDEYVRDITQEIEFAEPRIDDGEN